MGLYQDQVLPRCIDWVLRRKPYMELRRDVTPGLSGRVLEIGFGSGLNLPFYPKEVERVVALDPAELGRRLAEGRIRAFHAPVEFRELNCERYPLETASVDSVLSTWTLCSIPAVGEALAELRRVLRPGGRFQFLEHGVAPEPGVARWQRRLNTVHGLFTGGCRLDVDVPRLLSDAGFEIESIDTFYGTGPRFLAYMYRGVAVNPH